MLIGHGTKIFSRMETSNAEISKVTIASLLHLDVFCSLLLRIKCIQERDASVRYVSLVQQSCKNSWEILSPVYRNKLRPRFMKCVFHFTKICKNSFFCHRIFKFVRTGNYFFKLFRLRLRMCTYVYVCVGRSYRWCWCWCKSSDPTVFSFFQFFWYGF